MITLLGSILGLFGALLPELIKLFQDGKDKAHELSMLKAQAENAEKLREYDAKMMASISDSDFYIHEQDRLSTQVQNDKIGIKWIDGLNATVRPILAYGFFALYAYIKINAVCSVDLTQIIGTPWLVWSEEDMAIFAAIITFYFGSRTMDKFRKKA